MGNCSKLEFKQKNVYFILWILQQRKKKCFDSKSEDCAYDNAAEIVRLLKNKMHELKDKPDRHTVKLKKVPFKTGPKK